MNLDKVNKWLTLAANLGIITSIIFLVVEVQQNNQQLVAQARFNYYQQRANFQLAWGSDITTQEAIQKYRNEVELNPVELNRIIMQIRSVLTNWEYEYIEYQSGNISLGQFSVGGKRGLITGNGISELILEVWNNMKVSAPKDFMQFMDENVFY